MSNDSATKPIMTVSINVVTIATLPSRARRLRVAFDPLLDHRAIRILTQQEHARGRVLLLAFLLRAERLAVVALDHRRLFRVDARGRAGGRIRVHVLLGEEEARA